MNACRCGRDVRLRAFLVAVSRHRGVTHYIEHLDGTRVCVPGDWTCCALKPYKTPREHEKLRDRWNKATEGR